MSSIDSDFIAKRSTSPHRGGPDWINAAEAKRILDVSAGAFNRLIKDGKFPSRRRLASRQGPYAPFQYKRAEILALVQEGRFLKQKSYTSRLRVLYRREFGAIPKGYDVVARDGNLSNYSIDNLHLRPTREGRAKEVSSKNARRKSRAVKITRWTVRERRHIREEYPHKTALEIATELRRSLCAVKAQAGKMGIFKADDFKSPSKAKPLGSERIKRSHENPLGMVYVKVSMSGSEHEQWRPKHHVVWEEANGCRVPEGCILLFIDGDKRNFSVENLHLSTVRARFMDGFAQFKALPQPLQNVIKASRRLGRAISDQINENQKAAGQPDIINARLSPRKDRVEWTTQKTALLIREYSDTPTAELAELLAMTVSSVRQKARRIGLSRSMESMTNQAHESAAAKIAEALDAKRKAQNESTISSLA